MCYQVSCDTCKKITWKGCGKHVEQVMKDVKEDDKCVCNTTASKEKVEGGGGQKV